ncbi:MAG: hypothetical protein JNM55_08860 [Anaerolineales bacterium]|nr:hypothetical protein [Anaerolineales bacterium]
MTEEKKVCIQCERSDEQTPLIPLAFNGETKYICSQCLPVLIHKTHLLADKLPGIDISTNG